MDKKENLLERVNTVIASEIEKILENQGELVKLGEILKTYGVEDIGVGEIILGNS